VVDADGGVGEVVGDVLYVGLIHKPVVRRLPRVGRSVSQVRGRDESRLRCRVADQPVAMTSRERRTRKQYESVQLERTGQGYILTMVGFGFSDTKDRNIEKEAHVPVKDDVVKYCGAIVRVRNEHRGSTTTDSHVAGSSYETAMKMAPLYQGDALEGKDDEHCRKTRDDWENCTCPLHSPPVPNIGSGCRLRPILCMCPT